MPTNEEILSAARTAGFDHAGMLVPETLAFLPEVREMCASGNCGKYGQCWTCPPGCGTLEALQEHAFAYPRGVLLQSTGTLEDDFDVDTMMETERIHKERFLRFVEWLRANVPRSMPMSAGACTICQTCTYPDAPCRFPDRAIPSMEACGLLVSDACTKAGLAYYYGPRTITYSSCALFD